MQPELGSPPPPPAQVQAGPIREFSGPANEPWRISRHDLFESEFSQVTDLAQFVSRVSQHARSWLIVRRLFGIAPMIPRADSDPDDLRVWGREELAAALGVSRAQLSQEIDAVRGIVLGVAPTLDPAPPPASPQQAIEFKESILEKYGFPDSLFAVPGRDAAETQAERFWFSMRVERWTKLLDHQMAAELARQTLLNEMQIRRAEVKSARHEFGSKEHREVVRLQQEMQDRYREQLTQIDVIAPWAGAISGKMAFVGVVAELIEGHRDYMAKGDRARVDGIFTAVEIQVECRRSVQAPEPRYRAGLVVYLNAAKAGLWDPKWKSHFTPGQLKKLDAAWTAAAQHVSDEEQERLPDLESDDPLQNEYDPLHLPAQ